MRIGKYLSAISDQKRFKTDKELAAWLEVTPAAVCQYRSGARAMDNEKCVKIALELDVDPLKVIMATDMDRAERAGQKSLWEVFSQRTSFAAGVLALVGVTNFFTPTPAKAAPVLNSNSQAICVM